jgi:hypothetical protein
VRAGNAAGLKRRTKAVSVGGLCYPSLTATLLARRRIDFADGLRWLHDRGKSGAAACRTFILNPIRDWFFHF